MKKISLLISILFTFYLYAELPPCVYENYQKNAPESLTILTKKVETSLISFRAKSVTVIAKVLSVQRTKSKVKRGDTITIIYNTPFWKPSGWVGPSSLPVLKEGQTYRAFLQKNEHNKHYYPAARGKSFN